MDVGPSPAELASRIRALLDEQKVSGTALARRIGVSQPYVSRRLTGAREFTVSDLRAIANVLGLTLADLVTEPEGAAR